MAEGQRRLAILADEAQHTHWSWVRRRRDPLRSGRGRPGRADQAALDRLAERAAQVLAHADAEVAAAQGELDDRQATATHVATMAERWDRARHATLERAQLAAEVAAIDAARTRLTLAQQAEQVRPSLQAAEAAAETRRQADRAADRHLRRAADARDALHRAVSGPRRPPPAPPAHGRGGRLGPPSGRRGGG